MPELAPIETGPPQGSCPTSEDLACYVDGTLSAEEAARVTAHLASCESCFEVYSGVLQFQLESELETGGKVVPFPGEKRRPGVPWWASVAALLVVGLLGGYQYLLTPPPVLVTSHLAAPVQGRTGLEDSLWKGEIKRGVDEDEEKLPYELAAFRAGVQIVNLQVSLQTNDRERMTGYVIPGLFGALHGQFGADNLMSDYSGKTSIAKGETPEHFLLSKASQLAQELDPLYFDLGQWVEAGHLAAISHDPAFFQQPENRSFLRHVLWRDRVGFKDSKLPKESRQQLDAIYDILGKSKLQSADFRLLESHLWEILNANYPQS